MAVERNKLQELLKQLPEELQSEVLEFVESLLRKGGAGDPGQNGTSSVRPFFGSWDSGDPSSADNDRIDADLIREYQGSQ